MKIPDGVKKNIEGLAKELAMNHMAGEVQISGKSKGHHEGKGEEKEQAYDRLCNDLRGLLDGWDEHSKPYKDLKELLDDKQNVEDEEEHYDEEHGKEYY